MKRASPGEGGTEGGPGDDRGGGFLDSPIIPLDLPARIATRSHQSNFKSRKPIARNTHEVSPLAPRQAARAAQPAVALEGAGEACQAAPRQPRTLPPKVLDKKAENNKQEKEN